MEENIPFDTKGGITMEFAEYLPFWNKLTAEQQQRIAGVIADNS